ncbi:LppU/SCO3897 family protein [Klenkia taihuensis]|uniref:Uncharacterized protein n=1 Tax=Klenkia taihuensis TaxID=1225127 RepID=A0A1I1Q243_9ACTN|nr:hypothetical protein [Klenkia taihuensis]GHE08200.1 hypothetical protein GCM10011381_08040 [Klenkia taihuensis]SFD16109.1 hypothetical protein SAMN05661030_2568 [Klenkia taihuensis]
MTTPGSGDQPQNPGQQGWGQQPPSGQQGPGAPQPGAQGSPQSGTPGEQGQQWAPPGGQQQPGQQGWGQPGQPGQPQQFGQPGQPGQAQQFGQPGQPGQQPWGGQQFSGEAPKKERPAWQKRLPLVAGAVVVAIVIALFRNGIFGGGLPEAGDCTDNSITNLQVVDCDSDEAAYRVAGTVDDVSGNELQNNPNLCLDQWPDSAAYAVSETDPDEKGTGICLEPVS